MEKKLYRSRTDKKISGVCAGIANYFGIDVTLLRVVVAVLVLTSMFSLVIIYIVCAIIIPEEPEYIDVESKEK